MTEKLFIGLLSREGDVVQRIPVLLEGVLLIDDRSLWRANQMAAAGLPRGNSQFGVRCEFGIVLVGFGHIGGLGDRSAMGVAVGVGVVVVGVGVGGGYRHVGHPV